MFVGETSEGSLALAIAYAQYLHCQHREHYGEGAALRADSCGECASCKKYQTLSAIDLHFVFPYAATASKKNPSGEDFMEAFRDFLKEKEQKGTIEEWHETIGIENKQGMIREKDADNVVKTLSIKPYEGGYKVVIIWMAEKMNGTAANKLLKTLEEPSDRTLIILVAEETSKMLATIVSRVQQTRLPQESGKVMKSRYFGTMFVEWMRLLFKLNMRKLSQQVDKLASLSREEQKELLQYAMEIVRRCMLSNLAGAQQALETGDEKFDAMFPTMVTQNNAEQMSAAIEEALYATERNASAKINLMQLSFTLSKLLKKR